ncbi:acetylornithine transaminase [Enterococcus sp. HY326]|uniref:acetylornithine transaminase n=1 Tax=Enterococcus sp. HY326 TaxID=2971265 RepID=UPI00223F78F6|nr:acetylornithine transaminase [Enterococcus sp. HY326]
MSKLFNNYGRQAFEIISGQGSVVKDDQGREFLDFTSGIGVMNVGYGHPQLVAALQQQNEILWHMPNLYQSQLQETVAEKLIGKQDYLAFFCNSGAEANEAAIKLARKATGRSKIITFIDSFHGRTYGALSATGQASIQEGFGPIVPDFIYLPYNQMGELEKVLDDNTAAVMLEVIQGEGGVLPADEAWLQQLAVLCQKNNSLLIVDEVQTGMGRTGSLFAFEQFHIEPDIITLAKGLGNGIPVGAMLGKSKLGAAFGPGSHGSTFGGNKLAMAAANAVLDIMQEKNFLTAVQQKSALLFNELQKIESDKIVEIRGKGLMVGLVIADEFSVKEIIQELQEQGLLTLRAGQNVLRLLPSLTVTEAEIKQATGLIQNVLTKSN